jgi:hypothetical protein
VIGASRTVIRHETRSMEACSQREGERLQEIPWDAKKRLDSPTRLNRRGSR